MLTLVVALGTTLGTATVATSAVKAPSCGSDVSREGCYWYVQVKHRYTDSRNTGAYATLSQHKPKTATADDHSLAEIAVGNPLTSNLNGPFNAVEVGWEVNKNLFGDYDPHLFVFPTNRDQLASANCHGPGLYDEANHCHWHQVYNHPGYIPNKRGSQSAVTPGRSHRYGIQLRADGNWWVQYRGRWIGYFDAGFWSGNPFTGYKTAEWYGEVQAYTTAGDCTQMGNGLFGTQRGSASFSNMEVVRPRGRFSYFPITVVSDPHLYNIGNVTQRGFTYGGPGNCHT